MDYIYFVFCVAVLATILGFCWYQFVLKARTARGPGRGVVIPPRKHVTDSLSELEIKRLELQQSIDVWQRGRAGRIERLREEAETPVNGQKYVFVPPAESRVKKLRRAVRVPPRQRFELIS